MFKGMSLGARLLSAFFVIAAFSAIITTVVYIFFFSERIEQDALQALATRTHEAELVYQHKIDAVGDTARFLANTPSIQNFTLFNVSAKLEKYLQSLVKSESFHQIMVYGKDRQLIGSAHKPQASDLNASKERIPGMLVHRTYYEGEPQAATELIYTEYGVRFAITAVAPVYTRTLKPEVVGVVVIRHMLDDNVPLFSDIRGFFSGKVLLFHQGEVIASSDGVSESQSLSPDTLAKIVAADGLHQQAEFKHGGYLSSYLTLPVMDIQEGLVLALYMSADRFVETTDQAIQQLLGVMAVCILVALLLAWMLTRSILQPVRRLMEGVQQVTSGNMTYQIETDRQDELGQLAHAFNSMSRQLRDFLEVLSSTVNTLTRVGTALSSEKNLDVLLGTLIFEACKVSNADSGKLFLVHGEQHVFKEMASSSDATDGKKKAFQQQGKEDEKEGESVAEAELPLFKYVATHKRLLCADPGKPLPDDLEGMDVSLAEDALIMAPLLDHENNMVGVLQLRSLVDAKDRQGTHFSRNQIEIVRSLASQAAVAIESAKNYAKVERQNKVFSRFVPTEFLSHLGRKELGDIQLGDAVKERMVVMFCDIRSFTTFSEKLESHEIFSFLNSYLHSIGPAISENNGFIDKYIGDAIMALFSGPNQADDAMRASLAMRAALRKFNETRVRAGHQAIEIGIGIHYGPLALGTIGFEQRMESTVIGDTVNLAARIESLTKFYGIRIGVTGDFVGMLGDQDAVQIREVDVVSVRGRTQDTMVLEVLDPGDSPPLLREKQGLKDYHRALDHFKAGEWLEADQEFKKLAQIFPDDPVVMFHHRRSRDYRESPPEEWTGVTMFTK